MKLKIALTTVILAAGSVLAYAAGTKGGHGHGHCPMCGTMMGQMYAAGTDDGHGHGHSDAVQIGEPSKAEDATRSVEIALRDNYYEPESITVKKDETVRFVVKNLGVLVHEFNIGTADMHAAHKDEMLMMMQQRHFATQPH